ncbi:N-6 DNA methylase [Streptomyces sp. QH1-20]|uniref:N-6 DNA methylase n=1 Tax=Streptomyces sp. QH1-20 TaxID=3240934 RepID=UPI003516EF2D
MIQNTDRVSVTLAAIARLAGVGRAAVSNWRRRHADFPKPVGGTDASPLFALSEVEGWLKRHDKISPTAGALERLWPRVEDLADRDRMGRVVAGLGARFGGTAADPDRPLDRAERMLVDEAARLAAAEGQIETFRFLLDRWLGTHVRQIATTPAPLGAVMADIAAFARGTDAVTTVADPACGTGTLLLAAARRWSGPAGTDRTTGARASDSDEWCLHGNDSDPVLAAIAEARLTLEVGELRPVVTTRDALRDGAGPHAEPADVVLCNPPANERDWGHEELATDRRWLFGQPPRTESELAWVQHALSMLRAGGVAVLLLPPGVAARRAGRRIRAGLLRAGAIRAVIALPAGAAPPYGVGLHIWVLTAPPAQPRATVTLVDTADCRHTSSVSTASRPSVIDWDAVRDRTLLALQGGSPPGSVSVPVTDLLGEETDLTPARHAATAQQVRDVDLRRLWSRFDRGLLAARDTAGALRTLTVAETPPVHGSVSLAELELAKAVDIASGATVPEGLLRRGDVPEDGVALLTVLAAAEPGERLWLDREDAERADREGRLPLTSFGDVVVVAAVDSFDAWVETSPVPRGLGPHLHRVRVDEERLDPWFLAACLRLRSNARRAGTRSSNASRVDIRRLNALRVPLEEQRAYGEVHRRLVDLERELGELGAVGEELTSGLADLLAAGRLGRR